MEISKYKLNIEREFVRTDSKNELVKKYRKTHLKNDPFKTLIL